MRIAEMDEEVMTYVETKGSADNIYSEDTTNDLLESDELSVQEAAFMSGYNQEEEEEDFLEH